MSQIVALKERRRSVQQQMEKFKGLIIESLPKHLNAERMFRVYMTACMASPKLLECDPMTIVGAVMRAAQFGLSLETVMGEAFLIPRWNKHMRRDVANFQIGYKGLRKLALQGDRELVDMFAFPVYENDQFEYTLGLKPDISVHQPARGERGKIVYAYAVAVWKNDYRRFRVVDQTDIDVSLRTAGKNGKIGADSPWKTNPAAMWCKTAMLRLGGQMPLQSDVANMLAQDGTDGHVALRDAAADTKTRAALIDMGAADFLNDNEEVEEETEESGGALDNYTREHEAPQADAAPAEAEAEAPAAGTPSPAPGRRRRRSP